MLRCSPSRVITVEVCEVGNLYELKLIQGRYLVCYVAKPMLIWKLFQELSITHSSFIFKIRKTKVVNRCSFSFCILCITLTYIIFILEKFVVNTVFLALNFSKAIIWRLNRIFTNNANFINVYKKIKMAWKFFLYI